MKKLVLLLLLFSFIAYSADIKIPVQGYLTDNNGVALNGEQNIKFSIYDADENGNTLWSNQTTAIVTVTDGYFSYMLGTTDFIDSSILENSSPLYLEIEINNEILSPRIELGVESKAVFAYKADNSNKLEGKTLSDIKQEIDTEKLNSILSRLDALETEVSSLKAENTEKDSKIVELQDKVTALETANTEKDTKIATLETKVANLEANNFSGDYNDLTNKPTTITQAQSDAITQNTSDIASHNIRINNLETKTADMTIVTVNGYKTVRFSQVNLQVVNGTGATNKKVNGSINGEGLGNIIVGYNKLRGNSGDNRTGYHNLIIGGENSYSSYGGFVAGYNNTIIGRYSSISGGRRNTIRGNYSSISGGSGNTIFKHYSSISGGSDNTASETYSSISGGYNNTASGVFSSISGGYNNTASGYSSSISGGHNRSVTGDYDWRAGSLFESN